MRFKMAQSEVDGLFMKANRKHQIILGFELKRIAVEKKMRERYFAFEKSLIVSHRDKIVARQKALGIYRPKTTPDKKRNGFFITNVSMDTKGRTRLPPVDKANAVRHKEADGGSRRGDLIKRNGNTPRASLPEFKPGWSLTEIVENNGDDKLIDSTKDKNKTMDSAENENEKNNSSRENSRMSKSPKKVLLEKRINSAKSIKSDSLEKSKTETAIEKNGRENSQVKNEKEDLEKHGNIARDTSACQQTNADNKTTIDSDTKKHNTQEDVQKQGAQNGKEESTSDQETTTQKESLVGEKEEDLADARPKSASSGSVEGVRSELLNLTFRAQSAGVKVK